MVWSSSGIFCIKVQRRSLIGWEYIL